MSFLMPKSPKVVSTPAPTPAVQADASLAEPAANTALNPGSMISTSSSGLTRKASTVKSSLIGGTSAN